MDFRSDALFDGRPFRLLTVVDCCSREGLATVPRATFRAFNVVETLDRLVAQRGKPKTIRVDNGPEFAGRLLDQWAYLNGVELDFSRPGTPTDNAFIEAFNARIRAECLNASWFLSLADARERIEAWRLDYNTERPHSALGHLTPHAFARQAATPEKSHKRRARVRGKTKTAEPNIRSGPDFRGQQLSAGSSAICFLPSCSSARHCVEDG